MAEPWEKRVFTWVLYLIRYNLERLFLVLCYQNCFFFRGDEKFYKPITEVRFFLNCFLFWNASYPRVAELCQSHFLYSTLQFLYDWQRSSCLRMQWDYFILFRVMLGVWEVSGFWDLGNKDRWCHFGKSFEFELGYFTRAILAVFTYLAGNGLVVNKGKMFN